MVDITVLGDKELMRALDELPERSQKTAVASALRKSGTRLKKAIAQAYSGDIVGVDTGETRDAMRTAKVKTKRDRRRGEIRVTVVPDRSRLMTGGMLDAKNWYLPAILEYGSTKNPARYPARAPIRITVNRNEPAELQKIAGDIKKGIEREWKKLAKKARG